MFELSQYEYALYALSAVCGIGGVIAIPLNTYSANKGPGSEISHKEKIEKSAKRMAKEFKVTAPFSIRGETSFLPVKRENYSMSN